VIEDWYVVNEQENVFYVLVTIIMLKIRAFTFCSEICTNFLQFTV
jgi:hypothetical protein